MKYFAQSFGHLCIFEDDEDAPEMECIDIDESMQRVAEKNSPHSIQRTPFLMIMVQTNHRPAAAKRQSRDGLELIAL
jgi:hypothetical protein